MVWVIYNFWGNLNILCRYVVKGTLIISRVGVGSKIFNGVAEFFQWVGEGGVQLLIPKETYVLCYFSGGGGGGGVRTPHPAMLFWMYGIILLIWFNP